MNIDANASASTANPIAVITRPAPSRWVLVWSSVTMDVRFEMGPAIRRGTVAASLSGSNFIAPRAFDEKAHARLTLPCLRSAARGANNFICSHGELISKGTHQCE